MPVSNHFPSAKLSTFTLLNENCFDKLFRQTSTFLVSSTSRTSSRNGKLITFVSTYDDGWPKTVIVVDPKDYEYLFKIFNNPPPVSADMKTLKQKCCFSNASEVMPCFRVEWLVNADDILKSNSPGVVSANGDIDSNDAFFTMKEELPVLTVAKCDVNKKDISLYDGLCLTANVLLFNEENSCDLDRQHSDIHRGHQFVIKRNSVYDKRETKRLIDDKLSSFLLRYIRMRFSPKSKDTSENSYIFININPKTGIDVSLLQASRIKVAKKFYWAKLKNDQNSWLSEAFVEHERQTKKRKHKFRVCEKVLVEMLDVKKKWQLGRILSRYANNSMYTILIDNIVYRRHINQLQKLN